MTRPNRDIKANGTFLTPFSNGKMLITSDIKIITSPRSLPWKLSSKLNNFISPALTLTLVLSIKYNKKNIK